MFVTGEGEIIVNEVLPRIRALLTNPDAYITVEFVDDEVIVPCAVCAPEELDWELFFNKMGHDTHSQKAQDEHLKLKIRWRVNCGRTIIWNITVPE